MQEIARTVTEVGPRGLAVDPELGQVYVTCPGAGQVQVFTPDRLTLVNSLTFTSAPSEICFDPISREFFCATSSERRLFSFDFSVSNQPRGLSLCGLAEGLVFNPRTKQLYVSTPECGEIAVLRPESGLEFAPLILGGTPEFVAFDSDFRQLLVLLPNEPSLEICHPNRGSVISSVPLVGYPHTVVAP
jgi:DNA-binding beta-propeller fold protein YncE